MHPGSAGSSAPGGVRSRPILVLRLALTPETFAWLMASESAPYRSTMLLCAVKGFVWHFPGLIFGVVKVGERGSLLGCGQDRHPRGLDVKLRGQIDGCFPAGA